MKQTAVFLAPGFEEGETLTVADILRRAGIGCELVGFAPVVAGAHQIEVKCDRVLEDFPADGSYDMVILPGGIPGALNLRDSDKLMEILRAESAAGKWVAAICAAPVALERAGLLDGKNFTAYVGYDKKIAAGYYCEDIVVRDGNLITSRGPATVYAFGYALVDVLGGDSRAVKDRMIYDHAFEEGKVR